MRFLLLLLLALPVAAAQLPQPDVPYWIPDVTAIASNQRVDLTWSPSGDGETGYVVFVFDSGNLLTNRTSQDAQESFLLTNGRTYVFQVAAQTPEGAVGPLSTPVAATPQLENDLAYLAAGLITIWVGVFGYVAFLARKEAAIERKLERILQARFEGKNP